MRIGISRHGYPFLVISFALLLLATFGTSEWADSVRFSLISFFLAFFLLFLIFFRDPERSSNADANAILAPADGRVIRISESSKEAYPDSDGILISIFMSVLNVHVNRVPISGRVIKKEYTPGRFIPAFRDEAPRQNERCSLVIRNNGNSIVLSQVSGILARRIITYPVEGDSIVRGDRFGMILFGSRLDIVIPHGTEVKVINGQKTVAGKTVLGVL